MTTHRGFSLFAALILIAALVIVTRGQAYSDSDEDARAAAFDARVPVGTIWMSILPEAAFKKELGNAGKNWKLLWKDVENTKYSFPMVAGNPNELGTVGAESVGQHVHNVRFVKVHTDPGEPRLPGVPVPNHGYGEFMNYAHHSWHSVTQPNDESADPPKPNRPKHVALNFFIKFQ